MYVFIYFPPFLFLPDSAFVQVVAVFKLVPGEFISFFTLLPFLFLFFSFLSIPYILTPPIARQSKPFPLFFLPTLFFYLFDLK
ncbi:unnamed protein product [Meloidogyne enterolobii]|uniref:Uncharacterized protein n=1 Tax=Meloidogyne enterolobii TaxID=390850 RepID=A0ACB0ZT86_MELEN